MANNWRFQIQSRCMLNRIPENVMEGFKNRDEPLPATMWGMVNIHGARVHINFNIDRQYMDIITRHNRQSYEFSDVTDIGVYPIKTKEEYSYLCLYFGYTGTSKYWLFWVPSQYIRAMQEVVVGNWPGL